ncbi:RNA-binding protein [Aquabacterium sp. A7-Y]|uniref:RNA-binding protein n=1 Tax=Aquabacterium sp. A7-Y TaxID=1349605 RepID=UPI00223D8AD1|nr:RNA-binding protein [Aquabacterium sp. A7-Y]MCW7538543.1 RNA-binding protein [Aquabacterium sp. A7-Y]
MTRLLLGNIEAGTTDEEITRFLAKYGFPPAQSIEHLAGDNARSAAVLTFKGVNHELLQRLRSRIHAVHWKSRKITAQVLTSHFYD